MPEDVFSTDQSVDKTALEQLVGEGKKFATVEDLALGKIKSDSHIQQLEGEAELSRKQMAEIEGSNKQSEQVAELLAAVRKHQEVKPDEGDNQLSAEDLRKNVIEIMQGETNAQTRASNRELANQSVLDKVDGNVEAARTYIAERAKQLGMTPDALAELGETSPEAFTKLVEIDTKQTTPSISGISGVTTETLDGTPRDLMVDGTHTKAYYDKLKSEIGIRAYWSDPKIQGKYLKDAEKLGDRFNQQIF